MRAESVAWMADRYASIYRDFSDVEGFAKELDKLRSEDSGEHPAVS